MFQNEMAGEAKRAGLMTDDDIMLLVKDMRDEDD